MDFICFLLLNLVLYIRPAEFIPALLGLPLFELTLGLCLLTGITRLLGQARPGVIAEQPITVLVMVLLVTVVLSNLVRAQIGLAWDAANEFFKVVLYFMLLISIVDSTRRLVVFLAALVLFVTIIMSLTALDFEGYIHLPTSNYVKEDVVTSGTSSVADEQHVELRRMGSTGLFADPNEASMLIVQSLLIAGYFAVNSGTPLALRFFWVGPLALLGIALYLTQSRGGFLNLICSVLMFLMARFGRKFGLFLVAVCLPLILIVFGGRQTSMSVAGTTAHQRIQLWSEYLSFAWHNPLFGIGYDNWKKFFALLAHNSFIQCFADLGFVGGVAFLGAFGLAFWSVKRLAPDRVEILDPSLQRLRPLMLALVVSDAVGLMSLSCPYVIPTYTALGLIVAYTNLAYTEPSLPPLNLNARMLGRLAMAGVAFQVVMIIYCAIMLRVM